MKRTLLTALVALLAITASAQADIIKDDVVSIDLGGNDEGQSPTGDNWNNFGDGSDSFTESDTNVTLLADLIRRSDGAGTGVSLVLASLNGVDFAGTAATDFGEGPADFPETATQDVFYLGKGDADRTIVFELQNLDPALTYNLVLFGKDNNGDDRADAIFTADGKTDSYDPDNNTSDTAELLGLSPDSTGTLEITWSRQGSGETTLLSLMEITAVPEPATMSLLAIGGLGALIRRRRR